MIWLFDLRGQDPQWLSDGGGEVGVYTTPTNTIQLKKNSKKISKKNKKFRAFKKFGELKIFMYLCQSKMI